MLRWSGLCPIQEQIVEVIECESAGASMNGLFTFERRVVVQQLLTGVLGGLGRVVVRLQKHRGTARLDVHTTLSLSL